MNKSRQTVQTQMRLLMLGTLTTIHFILFDFTIHSDTINWDGPFCMLRGYWSNFIKYSKTCLKQPLRKKAKNWFSRLLVNAGQKYCRMLQGEHSAMLSLSHHDLVLSMFEWPLKTGFTVWCISVPEEVFILANSADPDEMPLNVALYFGLHCMPKYQSRGIQNEKDWRIEKIVEDKP